MAEDVVGRGVGIVSVEELGGGFVILGPRQGSGGVEVERVEHLGALIVAGPACASEDVRELGETDRSVTVTVVVGPSMSMSAAWNHRSYLRVRNSLMGSR